MKKANKKSKTPPATKRMAREISAEEIKQVSGGTGSASPTSPATNNNWIAQRSGNG